MQYIGKYSESQQFGGHEEGGWWYDRGYPAWKVGIPFPSWLLNLEWHYAKNRVIRTITRFLNDLPYKLARRLNAKEHERRNKENRYDYTSVLSHREDFYTYGFSDTFKLRPYPETRPHYE
jgi:hypothetical protein